jgi:hypothetical protein
VFIRFASKQTDVMKEDLKGSSQEADDDNDDNDDKVTSSV